MLPPARGMMVAGKYELVEEIGRGGMGVVWRAYAGSLGLHCALKMVLPSPGGDRDRLRLLREARVAAKLRSPYVVTIYDVGEWEGFAFIAMELLDGQSLGQLLATSSVLPTSLTLELIRQAALALEKAHAAGLVHRDLKPDNIFVVEREPLLVKLLDFGIAKQLKAAGPDSDLIPSITGAIVGTPRYMSPEQANGASDLDFRSDLWSLALIAFECLTGQLPFDGQTWPQVLIKICHSPIPVPSEVYPAVAPGFDAFWEAAAVRDPTRRPPSARAFAESLKHHLEHPPARATERRPSGRALAAPPAKPARYVPLGLVGAGTLAIGCAAVFALSGRELESKSATASGRARALSAAQEGSTPAASDPVQATALTVAHAGSVSAAAGTAQSRALSVALVGSAAGASGSPRDAADLTIPSALPSVVARAATAAGGTPPPAAPPSLPSMSRRAARRADPARVAASGPAVDSELGF